MLEKGPKEKSRANEAHANGIYIFELHRFEISTRYCHSSFFIFLFLFLFFYEQDREDTNMKQQQRSSNVIIYVEQQMINDIKAPIKQLTTQLLSSFSTVQG
jgi:hypothetical protein